MIRSKLELEIEIDRLHAELAKAEASRATYAAMWLTDSKAIARVRAVITDHECCSCLVRADGCEHMWNEMREVFRPAFDGDTE